MDVERRTAIPARAISDSVEQPDVPELSAPAGLCPETAKETPGQGQR